MRNRKFKNKALWKKRISESLSRRGRKNSKNKKPGAFGKAKASLGETYGLQKTNIGLRNSNVGLQNSILKLDLEDRLAARAGAKKKKNAAKVAVAVKVVGGVAGAGAVLGGGVFAASKLNKTVTEAKSAAADIPSDLYEGAKTTVKQAQKEVVQKTKATVEKAGEVTQEHFQGNFQKAKANFKKELNNPFPDVEDPWGKRGRSLGKAFQKKKASTQKLLSPVTDRVEAAKQGKEAYTSEMQNSDPDKGSAEYKVGRGAAKFFSVLKNRARKDSAKRKQIFGFSSENFWLEFGKRKELEGEELLQFAASRKRKKGKKSGGSRRRKPLTAAHKAKISRALTQNNPSQSNEEVDFYKNQRKLATIGTVVAIGSQAVSTFDRFKTGEITREAMKSGITDRRITSVGAGVAGVGIGVGSIGRAFGEKGLTPYQKERIGLAKAALKTKIKNAKSFKKVAKGFAAKLRAKGIIP
jgi:hypothetical protein